MTSRESVQIPTPDRRNRRRIDLTRSQAVFFGHRDCADQVSTRPVIKSLGNFGGQPQLPSKLNDFISPPCSDPTLAISRFSHAHAAAPIDPMGSATPIQESFIALDLGAIGGMRHKLLSRVDMPWI